MRDKGILLGSIGITSVRFDKSLIEEKIERYDVASSLALSIHQTNLAESEMVDNVKNIIGNLFFFFDDIKKF